MLGSECPGQPRAAFDARQFFAKDVVEDEVGTGIGSDQLDAGRLKNRAQSLVVLFIVQQVAVEEFHAGVAGGADLADGLLHVAEGAVGELRDRGDADRVASQRSPTIGVTCFLPGHFALQV